VASAELQPKLTVGLLRGSRTTAVYVQVGREAAVAESGRKRSVCFRESTQGLQASTTARPGRETALRVTREASDASRSGGDEGAQVVCSTSGLKPKAAANSALPSAVTPSDSLGQRRPADEPGGLPGARPPLRLARLWGSARRSERACSPGHLYSGCAGRNLGGGTVGNPALDTASIAASISSSEL
jgi:hypothetical protein